MADFFDSIVNFFDMIWTLISNGITNAFQLINVIIKIPQVMVILNFAVPAVVYVFIPVIISISIIKLVLEVLP